jgi:hypothetical protein
MKTKLFTIALILILSAPLAMAQSSTNGKISLGILGGVNLQNLTGKDNNGDKLENDMLTGFHAGVNLQMPIAPEMYFQPGILFSTKGAKNSYGSLTGTYKLTYIELPLNVVYKGALGNGFIMVGFGPYVGYAIGGKSSLNDETTSIEKNILFKNNVEAGDPYLTAYMKRFDAGGNIFAGFEMAGGLFIQLDTQFGMININPKDNRFIQEFSDKLSVKNTGFGLSLGYRF